MLLSTPPGARAALGEVVGATVEDPAAPARQGRELTAVPLHLPADRAIGKGVPAVNAEPEFTRPFTAERAILQRERRTDVPGWLWAAASLVVLACSVALVASLALGVGRLNRSLQGEPAPREPARPARASARASVMRWPGARASRVS